MPTKALQTLIDCFSVWRNTHIKIIDYFKFISSLYLCIQKIPVSSGDYAGQSSFCNALGDCWNIVIDILVLHTIVMAYKAKCYLPYLIPQKVVDVLNCVDLLKLFCWFPWHKGFPDVGGLLWLTTGHANYCHKKLHCNSITCTHTPALCRKECQTTPAFISSLSMGKRGELLFLSYQAHVSGAEGRKYQKARSQFGVSLCLCLWPLTNGISCLNWIPVSIYGLPWSEKHFQLIQKRHIQKLKCCSVPVLSTLYMLAVLQQMRKVHLTTVIYCVYYGLQLLTVMQLGWNASP